MFEYIFNRFWNSPFKSSQYVLIFGFGLLMNHKYRTVCSFNSELSDIQYPSKLYFLHLFFNRSFSRLFSKITDIHIPQTFRLPIFKTLVYVLNVDMNELLYPLDSYETLGMFFSRDLPDSARPIHNYSIDTLVSPVDGKVMTFGEIDTNCKDRISQINVKGAKYNINCFVGEKIVTNTTTTIQSSNLSNVSDGINHNTGVNKLYYVVLRIPPGAYHHFHSPVTFKLFERRYFPGEFIPLKFSRYFPDIFTVNERVVFKGFDTFGNTLFIVPVGSFCRGKITHNIDKEFCSNRDGEIQVYLGGPIETKSYDIPITYNRGDKIGEFKQGSAVVLIIESNNINWDISIGDMVKVGHKIASVCKSSKS